MWHIWCKRSINERRRLLRACVRRLRGAHEGRVALFFLSARDSNDIKIARMSPLKNECIRFDDFADCVSSVTLDA